jgi:hypothetical protein
MQPQPQAAGALNALYADMFLFQNVKTGVT